MHETQCHQNKSPAGYTSGYNVLWSPIRPSFFAPVNETHRRVNAAKNRFPEQQKQRQQTKQDKQQQQKQQQQQQSYSMHACPDTCHNLLDADPQLGIGQFVAKYLFLDIQPSMPNPIQFINCIASGST
jgi:hypothetical protein